MWMDPLCLRHIMIYMVEQDAPSESRQKRQVQSIRAASWATALDYFASP